MLIFCLTLFLSACVSDPAAGCGLNGFYANMDQFTVYEFNGPRVNAFVAGVDKSGIYTMSESKITVKYDDGDSDSFSYDSDSELTYYDEKPEIMTPDSRIRDIAYYMTYEGGYFYTFTNDDTLARSVVFYDAYLESKGYSVEDVTESVAAAEGGEM